MIILLTLADIQEYLVQTLAFLNHYLTELRTLAKKHVLVALALPFLSMFPFGVAQQTTAALLVIVKALSGEWPSWVYALSAWLHKTTPYHFAWYSRIWLLFYLGDLYFTTYTFDRRWGRLSYTFLYIALKSILVFAPFFVLTPDDRMYLWALTAAFFYYECYSIHCLIQGIGRGVDWRFDSIYAAWGPNFHYRRMSGNRQIAMRFAPVVYPMFKFTLVAGMWWDLREGAVHTSSYVPEKKKVAAELLSDFSTLPFLIEPDTAVNVRYGVLFMLALSSLSVYSIILAGWSSNSKYAFIGALRSAAQMVSYEVSISLILLPVILMSGSLNFSFITHVQSITTWFAFPLLPVSCLFLIAMLAETNRTPFDLPEAEAELVAGYNVDYSSLPFAMFFLGEYCNMILISVIYCILFLAGGLSSLAVSSSLVLTLKAAIIWIFFVIVRASLPRYRYDQLMDIGWKVFLPLAGGFVVLVFGILVFFNALPITTELPLDAWNSFSR